MSLCVCSHPRLLPRAKKLLVGLLAGLLSACADYSLTLNQQPLGKPQTLLTVADVADDNLANCLQQTVLDQGIQQPDQLRQLQCSYGGIADLEGLAQFTELTHLDLSHNELNRVALLSQLSQLQHLDLRHNPTLNCDHLVLIERELEPSAKIHPPAHCRSNSQ